MFDKPTNVNADNVPHIKALVTVHTPQDADKVKNLGCQVLADYPDSLLVRISNDQQQHLQSAGMEVVQLPQPPVQIAGSSFHFADAMAAQQNVPLNPVNPDRTAYYLVQLVGPAKGDWLQAIQALGGAVHGSLPSYTLLVGLPPRHLKDLENHTWVENVTPYRPAMKVASSLRAGSQVGMTTAALAPLHLEIAHLPTTQTVQVSVFSGESTAQVAELIRTDRGTVLSELPGASVTAVVQPSTVAKLAAQPGVQMIVPKQFPRFHNDRAATVMGNPVLIGPQTLDGAGQIIGIIDSGLDTGSVATLHEDIRGRVLALVSRPINPSLRRYTNESLPYDDGPADPNSAHGTHVTGSVLGNGSTAASINAGTVPAGTSPIPAGLAPRAQVHFQAVEQKVRWKSLAQLDILTPPLPPFTSPWPPDAASLWGLPDDLGDLFQAAYVTGARICTNSWGSPGRGEYTDEARQVDDFMWNHRDALLLFSAGNDGVDADANGIIDASSIGSPASAKNCLTVGACENDRPHLSMPTPGIDGDWNTLGNAQGPLWPNLPPGHVSGNPAGMCAFSSRGPAADGRIKPDVVAPGSNILSTRSSAFPAPPTAPLWGDLQVGDPLQGQYCWSGGTSMSAPLTAGAAAIVRQHLTQQRGHDQPSSKPSGALLKAYMINGAIHIDGASPGEIPPGVNSVSGFGRVNLADPLNQMQFDDEPGHAVETMQTRTFTVPVAAGAPHLKVTLVWTDAPSPAGIGGLQNKLYLQVTQPDGTTRDGDVLPYPQATNNVQQVVFDHPAAGTATIQVRGITVVQQSPGAELGPNPRQDFAIVVSGVTGLVFIS